MSNDNGETSWQDAIFTSLAKQQFEIKPRPTYIQSPVVLPRIIPESPNIIPIQFEEPYNFMERRKSSFHGKMDMRKGTEDDLECRRMPRMRKESINPQEWEVDKDGFRKPKDSRFEREDQDMQEFNSRREAINMMSQMRLLSPAIFPEGASPLIRSDDRKDSFRALAPMNASFVPVTVATPMLSHTLVAPPYSPEAMHYLQPAPFGYSHEYGVQRCDRPRKNSECCIRIGDVSSDGLQPRYFCSPFMQPSPIFSQVLAQPAEQLYAQQDDFRLDGEAKQEASLVHENKPEEEAGKVGGLSLSERQKKIRHYLEKRKHRIWKKKISYDCRKKVADKRLRIKGRFVTREQAYSLLGTTPEDLANNKLLRTLINANTDCSIVTSANNMRIRNIQTLFSTPNKKGKQMENEAETEKQAESNQAEDAKAAEDRELRVEILKKNIKDQIVEIKIENILKKDNGREGSGALSQNSDEQLPTISSPIFQFKRLSPQEFHPDHYKYHRE
eukprot:TRINITY_DN8103_c0_g1_i8.p1 TRINITY_DN8103_c0_g1~~TRINITY_DN8103_c0_g1_i8.p1  ORF type:complete len:500 (-),score=121.26 TRINITY_DN8103_c0_g1_i8:161-1660(-)